MDPAHLLNRPLLLTLPASGDMQALVLEKPGIGGLRQTHVPTPLPGPGEVLVRVAWCGLGGTVLKKVEGAQPGHLPRIPGHEAVGEVTTLGADVDSIRPGDRVMLYFYLTCGHCRWCDGGRPSLCLNRGRGELRLGEHVDGALAEFVRVPARNVVPLPDGLDPLAATVAIDALATPVHICRRAGAGPGERLLVLGAGGGVGIHLLQLGGHLGLDVVGVDRDEKLEAVADRAPKATLLPAQDRSWPEDLAGAADLVVDFVGTKETLALALSSTARGGRLMVLTREDDAVVPLSGMRLVRDEVTVMGSKYATHAEVAEAARLLLEGHVRPVITEIGELSDVPRLLARIRDGQLVGRAAVGIGASVEATA